MVTICGTVKSNILWHKHAEKTNTVEPTMGSILVQIQSISELFETRHKFYSKTYNCNYSQTAFVKSIPFMEIIYKVNHPHYTLVEKLTAGQIVNLQIWKEAIYNVAEHFITIKESLEGQTKLWYVKVDGKESNLRSVEYLPNYHTESVTNHSVISAEELIYKLVPSAKPTEEEIYTPDYFSVVLKPKVMELV
jgi:hypothetical protein